MRVVGGDGLRVGWNGVSKGTSGSRKPWRTACPSPPTCKLPLYINSSAVMWPLCRDKETYSGKHRYSGKKNQTPFFTKTGCVRQYHAAGVFQKTPFTDYSFELKRSHSCCCKAKDMGELVVFLCCMLYKPKWSTLPRTGEVEHWVLWIFCFKYSSAIAGLQFPARPPPPPHFFKCMLKFGC